jgi:hypothetical protein
MIQKVVAPRAISLIEHPGVKLIFPSDFWHPYVAQLNIFSAFMIFSTFVYKFSHWSGEIIAKTKIRLP